MANNNLTKAQTIEVESEILEITDSELQQISAGSFPTLKTQVKWAIEGVKELFN